MMGPGTEAQRLAYAYPLCEEDAAILLAVAARAEVAEEACKVVARGFRVHEVNACLMFSEATTAEGIEYWIRQRHQEAR